MAPLSSPVRLRSRVRVVDLTLRACRRVDENDGCAPTIGPPNSSQPLEVHARWARADGSRRERAGLSRRTSSAPCAFEDNDGGAQQCRDGRAPVLGWAATAIRRQTTTGDVTTEARVDLPPRRARVSCGDPIDGEPRDASGRCDHKSSEDPTQWHTGARARASRFRDETNMRVRPRPESAVDR